MAKFTRHDQEMIEIFSDPVKWAAHHLGTAPRWYQEEILRHPHHRKVLRCGRRIGKCIEETQRVLNPITGEYIAVGEMYTRFKDSGGMQPLVTLNEEYALNPSEAFFIEDNGIKESFRVRTKYGAEVVLTGNHPVLTLDGWVEVDALKIGDRIATPKALPYFGSLEMEDREIKLLAYLIGDGSVSGNHISFTCYNDEILSEFQVIIESYNCELRQDDPEKRDYRIVGKQRGTNPIYGILRKHGVLGKTAHQKNVPSDIFKLPKNKIALFLSRLYSTDGWAHSGTRPEIGYCSVSKQLTIDVKHLLTRFGIWSNLCEKKVKYKGENRRAYQLLIHRKQDVLSFVDDINIFAKEEATDSTSIKALKLENQDETVPKEVWKHIETERKEKGLTRLQVAGVSREQNARLRMQYAPSLSKVADYAENLQSAFLYDLARSDLHWEEVAAIESIGERQTYDVFVAETHNLVVEDVLVHNTWTMCAHMLWVVFTCNGGKKPRGATCVVATPYDNQARLIFDQLKEFIDNNPALSNSIVGMTRNPYIITFKNGSVIKLFTAGTRSGAEGGSLRGQKADWLYMDEVDYMTDKDFETIYAIALEAPQRIGVMVASTPTGRRGMFYKLCTEQKFKNHPYAEPWEEGKDEKDRDLGPMVALSYNKDIGRYNDHEYRRDSAQGWAEFYFPTMVNPEWSPSLEAELRGMYSQVAYEHEVLAEFGTEMIGVFNKDFIDEAASMNYPFLDTPRYSSPITIGVDWDKFGAATQIVVVQWDPFETRRAEDNVHFDPSMPGRFRVINRVEIPKGEFTYDKAVDKICELDAIYNPAYIYPDRGAGEYQIEMLRKRLGDKVKGIHLGSSQEVRDPHSREFDKKPTKAFMVNQTQLLLERGMLRIPHPKIDETISRQMTNYTVVRISPKTGEPTFSDEDEHALDAMMLALLAFINEMPDIARTIHEIQVARTIGSASMKFVDPLKQMHRDSSSARAGMRQDWDEPGHPQRRVPLGWSSKKSNTAGTMETWGKRGSSRGGYPTRGSW